MASQGRKLQTWDEETHCDLLAAFYEVCSSDQMKEVVDKTSAMGYEYTLRAVTYSPHVPFMLISVQISLEHHLPDPKTFSTFFPFYKRTNRALADANLLLIS